MCKSFSTCNECLQGRSNWGLVEFLGRRLDEYQCSLQVIYGRLQDFRSNSLDLLNDFEHLLNHVSQIKTLWNRFIAMTTWETYQYTILFVPL